MNKTGKQLDIIIKHSLSKVLDPELHVSIVDLGLIYSWKLNNSGLLEIEMTLTTPGCPLAPVLEAMIKNSLKGITEVKEVKINLVFDPPWEPSKMTPGVRRALGF